MNALQCLVLLLALTPLALGAYQVVSVTNGPSGGQTYYMTLISGTQGPYGADSQYLKVDVLPYTDAIVRVTVRDANVTRWEVPNILQLLRQSTVKPHYNVNLGQVGSHFNLQVTRLSDGVVVFDTTGMGDIIYENQYLSLTTKLPNNPTIYGLGERNAPLKLPTGQTYTIFARDNATPYLLNVYGAHAFYMEMRSGSAHGVYLLNSNAMDVQLNATSMTYKVIGGVLDFFFMMGPTPHDVTRQYISIIGKPEMIPYWTLGWQQCRWGYNTLNETKAVVNSYLENNIPLEVMWNDIDYMDAYKDFTTDPVRFPAHEMKAFVDSLHANNQHYVMIIDPGIKIEAGYKAYEEGLKDDIYIRNKDGNYLTGMVWPGMTFFPDFTHPATPDYWYRQLNEFHKMVPYDGIWIDMNEVANFCDGECPAIAPVGFDAIQSHAKDPSSIAALLNMQQQRREEEAKQEQSRKEQQQQSHGHSSTRSTAVFDPDNPPYSPANGGSKLYQHTIYLSAKTRLGLEYDVHSLYGHYEAISTRLAANKIFGKRSLVVSRSTYAGSGRHTSHWLGDNASTWLDLHLSIAGVIQMNMFGIPHVGADICGFGGNTSKELCTRWIQLGAFYPFSRDHNAIGMVPQEPYVFGPEVAKIAANVIRLKYTFLPYYYTLHYHAHVSGDPVARGLFYEFPQDTLTYDNDVQMLIGPYLLITPVLSDGARIVDAYFPADVWYDLFSGNKLVSSGGTGATVQLDAPIDKINVHVRGGAIIPRQAGLNTTAEARRSPYSLLVARDVNGHAHGDLFIDDGSSFRTVEQKMYSHISFNLTSANVLTTHAIVSGYRITQPIGEIVVYGVTAGPRAVVVNGVTYSQSSWNWSSNTKRLTISKLTLNVLTSNSVSWQ